MNKKIKDYLPFWNLFRPFSLDHFDDYEKHFTVMNYVNEGENLKQVNGLFNYIETRDLFKRMNMEYMPEIYILHIEWSFIYIIAYQ